MREKKVPQEKVPQEKVPQEKVPDKKIPEKIIQKSREFAANANLCNYTEQYSQFSWDQAFKDNILGLPDSNGLNMAYECIDKHLANRSDHIAIRFLSKEGEVHEFSYEKMAEFSNKFANALDALGLKKGDAVFSLTGRIPELYMAVFGILKNRSVYSPLFSAFGPEPIKSRMELGSGKAIITTPQLYKKKIEKIRDGLPQLEHVILVSQNGEPTSIEGTHDFWTLVDAAPSEFHIQSTNMNDPALLHFTSGTTGTPKGAVHRHKAVLAHLMTAKFALDLHPEDTYWCTADPGWVTGTSYGILAPMAVGATMIVDEQEFDAERWYKTLADNKVTVWYTAPTAIRMMMRSTKTVYDRFDLSALRFIGSVGEPLNPEAIYWAEKAFRLPIHDNWWQTETGGIMMANYLSMPIKPGSMGKPLPGIEAQIVNVEPDGTLKIINEPDVEGELAIHCEWPSMFQAYLGMPERYQKCFVGGYYLSGDLAKKDADGYFWFVGRADDVIKSAGHLIGPFEVESTLIEHEAVAEAGVIGKEDPLLGAVVKAFVSLNPGYEPSDDLIKSIMAFVRKKLGPAVAPREIEIQEQLPKTRSGKIMRRLLKAREEGLPEGDISTLDTDLK